jgi:hypothetical protein
LERRGVIHRDYKLENIMIIHRKVVEFLDQNCPNLLPVSRERRWVSGKNKTALDESRTTRGQPSCSTLYAALNRSDTLFRRDAFSPWLTQWGRKLMDTLPPPLPHPCQVELQELTLDR